MTFLNAIFRRHQSEAYIESKFVNLAGIPAVFAECIALSMYIFEFNLNDYNGWMSTDKGVSAKFSGHIISNDILTQTETFRC